MIWVFKIGDKVYFDDRKELIGYVVGVSIDPFEENEVNYEKDNLVTYTVRRFAPFYQYGYTDFHRGETQLLLVEKE